jgi:hypothetical protein
VEVTVKTVLVPLAGAMLLLLGAAGAKAAPPLGPTAYYGDWQQNPNGQFFVRNYYFLPGDSARSYKHLQLLWLPGRQHIYYYNPYTRQILGRSSVQAEGHDQFFALPRGQELAVDPAKMFDFLQNNNVLSRHFKSLKAASFPTEISLGTAPAASVPIMPPPDDPPVGTAWPPPG